MKSLPLALLALLASPAYAANLMEVYRDAQQQDAAYASARAAYEAGQEKAPQGLALLLPSINLSANTSRNEVDSPTSNRQYNANGYNLSLTQPVYRKQNFALYEQSKSQVVQAEAQFAVARQDLIVRVAQAYFDVLLAQDNVALAGAQKAAIGEQLEMAKRNFEVGTVTITDTHEAQARFDLTTAQEIAAQNDLEIKNRALQLILGKIPAHLNALNDKLPLVLPEPNDMTKWVEQAEQQSPQIAIQRAALEIATQEVERNRGGHHPTLDLVAGYGQSSNSSYLVSGTVTSQTVGLQLNLPIFQGGSVNSKVREALANKEKARQDLELGNRQAALQTRQAFLGVTSGLAQVKALEQALVSSQSSLDSTRLGQEVGVRTNVDVLNAQQQLYTAKRDLSQARYNYIISQLKLKSAVGSLQDEDVEQVNRWLGK
ncbi:TolC family type I secretion outer membrane protein [Sulfuricella denitrificans skB26]|uniref:TolC family type I secretion outer membrane protein n=2 Tax=Sulfuricella denitrificans TaxID=649841 RepID=S6B8S1_SULDS|nr:TolC family type I secretion outer membrane protein [Sulfuricella denitrificans skB26]